jgi:hypothetical protein
MFQPSEVLDLRSFNYDSKTDKIVQEQIKKVPATEGMLVSVVTHFPITRDIRDNPIVTYTIGFSFMNANLDNIHTLCQQNVEKEARIREMEERLQQVRIDERNLQSFKSNVQKVRRELEDAIIEMYSHLHILHQATTTIIENNNQIQKQLMQYNTICEGIIDIDRWITKNPNAPLELYQPSPSEINIDLYALDHFQQVGKRADKEVTKPMTICSKLHKIA